MRLTAEKRMFAKSIVLSDAFLDMPMSARCLYFTFGMLADDDGFVGNPKSIMRQCGATEDDMKILIAKRYVLVFESGVIVIKHWRVNNYLRSDRHVDTTYKEEMQMLTVKENGSYTEKDKSLGVPPAYHIDTQNSIDKNSIDKNSIELIAPPSNDSDAEVFDKLPCLSNQIYIIHTEEVETYRKRFPAVDVEQELRNAVSWAEANPKNRKTLSGAKRFLTNWLIKAQNRSRAYSERSKSGVTYIDIE